MCGVRRVVLLAALTLACSQSAPTPKVLLIGLDGVRVDILAQANTPNIDALAEGGLFSDASGSSVMESNQPDGPFIVDIAVTALDHLGVAIDPAWGLDGTVRR